MITSIFTLILCISGADSFAQGKISGTFPQLAGQQVKLERFDGFHTYEIAKTSVSEEGGFDFGYDPKDYGMGWLKAEDHKPFLVILSGEDIHV